MRGCVDAMMLFPEGTVAPHDWDLTGAMRSAECHLTANPECYSPRIQCGGSRVAITTEESFKRDITAFG